MGIIPKPKGQRLRNTIPITQPTEIMGKDKPKPPAKPAAVATPTEGDTVTAQRGTQRDALKKKKQQQTVYGGAPKSSPAGATGVGGSNVLG